MNTNNSSDSYLLSLVFPDINEQLPRVISSPAADFHSLVSQKNDLKDYIELAEQECLSKLEGLRQQAYTKGYEEGLKQILEECAYTLDSIKLFGKAHQRQIIELTMGCIDKICGTLPQDVLTTAILTNALTELIDEPVVTAYVHPDIAAGLESQNLTNIRIETDTSLDITECKIETAHYIKDISLTQQLDALRQQLESTE